TTTDLPGRTVDNTAPTGAIVSPAAAAILTGTRSVTITANDATSGVASVELKLKAPGQSDFATVGSDSTSPFAIALNTAGRDAGNSAPSNLRSVAVDNTAPTGSLTSPSSGAVVANSNVPLAASATDASSGVASVKFQYRVSGGGVYTDVSTDTSAPYTATWNP